jgi:hypothetical protein
MKQTVMMSISIKPSEKEKLRELAEIHQLSMSSYIGTLVNDEYYKYTESLKDFELKQK